MHDAGEADGQVFIAMECIDGTPLDAVAERGVPWARVVDIGIQLADAPGHAHRSGIIHRDLKGTNVLVTAEGRLKILDFGLAVHNSPDLVDTTRSPLADRGALAGTLAYMAPEILAGTGQASERSDIWSLGVLLYEIAAGDRPFRGATAFDLTSSVLRDAPQPIPASIPGGLATVIGRCLEKDPARRYASMSEVRSALEVTAAPGSHRPPVEPRRAVWPRRAIAWPCCRLPICRPIRRRRSSPRGSPMKSPRRSRRWAASPSSHGRRRPVPRRLMRRFRNSGIS